MYIRLSIGCDYNVVLWLFTTLAQCAHNVPLSLHFYVGSQPADLENVTCIQRCYNVELFAGIPLTVELYISG